MTAFNTDLFSKFRAWYAYRHEYARVWKERTGGKVIGTFCTYVPEELICAAGILPVRILGSHEPEDITDQHIVVRPGIYLFEGFLVIILI